MVEYDKRIKELEDELSNISYNKRTQHHYGLVRAKIAQLKGKDEARRASKKAGKGYTVRKSGDATVIIIGFPSCGKSTLLNALTSAKSEVGAYEFTTLNVIPGVLKHRDAQIQVLDVPGVLKGAASGRGRGKEVLGVMQSSDLVIILIDVERPYALDVLRKEIYDANLRLNRERPDVRIKKTIRGGIRVGKTVKLDIDDKTIEAILKEFRINNADVLIRSRIGIDELIDAVQGNKRYLPCIVVMTKIDMAGREKMETLNSEYKPDICVSAEKNINIEQLKDMIFEKLNFIRIYCKEVGKKADVNVPMILRRGATLKTMCEKLHRDFIVKFKFARLWGPSARFDGQKILKLSHELKDRDIVEIHL